MISTTVHTSSALSRVAWEPVSYHWIVIATTQWFQDGSAMRVLIIFRGVGAALRIQMVVFYSGSPSVIPRKPQHLRHLRTCRKCSFWSLTPDFRPQQPSGGVRLSASYGNAPGEAAMRGRSRTAGLPAAFPLSGPRPAASPRAF